MSSFLNIHGLAGVAPEIFCISIILALHCSTIINMEFVVPIFALSSLYIINNQTKKKSETFRNRSLLPNADVPDKNYPSELPVVSEETDRTSQLSTNNKFDNGGSVYTDKYFNPNMATAATAGGSAGAGSGTDKSYYSLTGDRVDSSYFSHNNMQPYFGSHLKNLHADANQSEGILDNYAGTGSQHITKSERSPMFSPVENAQWAYGAPNQSDFIQSRINPSLRMANVKPFEEEIVGPGLGLGYTTQGAGGFNSGMMAREQWLDKTVDQLRVNNNPKASGYGLYGHEGPANSHIKTMATSDQMGVMEKNRPETSFEMGQDRYFTTTGAGKGETMRPITVERFVSRPETTASYTGVAGAQNSETYLPGEYMPTHNQQFGEIPMGIANANGRQYATDSDYEIRAKKAYPNNRSANQQDGYFGLVSGSLGAVVAPLLDMLRPSRKENTIGNLRLYENAGTRVSESYIFNPADRPAATIRETTENSKFHLNVNANQNGGAYSVTEHQPDFTYRTETGDFMYMGNAGAGDRTRQMTSYEANYNQRNNDIKSSTIQGYMVQGNMGLMNGDVNMRQVSRDGMLKNNRAVAANLPAQSPDIMNMGRLSGNDNALYSNIQMDRNNLDIKGILKSNPYVNDYKSVL